MGETTEDAVRPPPAPAIDRLSVVDPPAETATRSRVRIVFIMVGLCSAVFLAALNQTVVATAIPTISKELKSDSGYAWISAAYLLANAVAAPIWTKLSDIWGRKAILLTAVALYAVFSVVCALASDMATLVAGRALQGTAGGGLVQVVYAVIADLFDMHHVGRRRPGTLAGGALAERASWRWIFWMNLPIASVAFVVLWVFLDAYNPKTGMREGLRAVDWPGSASLLVFMVALLLGLNFGGTLFPWNSPAVICLLVGGALMAVVFICWEKEAPFPLVPVGLFGVMSNVGVLVIGFAHDWVVFSVEFYLPLYFQSVRGASPLESGYLIIPITLTQAVVAMCAGFVVHKTGRYLELIWIGVGLLTIGNGLYIQLDADSSLGSTIAFQLTASATATLGLVRNLSTSIAIVVGGVIFANGMTSRRSGLIDQGVPVDMADRFSGSSAASDVTLVGTIQDGRIQLVVKDAYAGSLQAVWVLCTCVAACAVIASTVVSKQVLSKVHVEHRPGLR
ncbi:Efflux pump dotC [Apiospora kogelbergensis]|uniref:Efflux pump dotC n=1 Tax=Apiospora kogelbergensis TaxID=1337665 RepID=UPI00312F3141